MTRTTLDDPSLYNIGWIAALSIERAAATASLDDRHDEPRGFEQHPSDANSYTWGRIGKHNIVIASLPAGSHGVISAATTASQLLASLPGIKIGLMVGIGGGIAQPPRQDIRLGDIVVSQPEGTSGGVIQFDRGKAKSSQTWEPTGFLNAPPFVLLHAVDALKAEHEISSPKIPELLQAMWTANPQMIRPRHQNPGFGYQGPENDRLFEKEYEHPGNDDCDNCDPSRVVKRAMRDSTDPEIHYGVIASGNSLIKDAIARDDVVKIAGKQCLCVEMEAAGLMNSFPCLVIRGISDYADSHKNDRWQRYAAATAAAYAKELLGYVPARQLEVTRRAVDVVESIKASLGNLQSTTLNIEQGVQDLRSTASKTAHDILLDRLPVAIEAAYNSHAEDSEPKCLPNTRVDLLHEITQWAENLDMATAFWLNGMAGTGKSTISRSVAETFAKKNCLGASFFFKRGEGDRGNLSKFFSTIASQLAQNHSAMARHIKEALDADPRVFDKGLALQFEKLIQDPLAAIVAESGNRQPVAIVIDALDECEMDGQVRLESNVKLVIRLFVRSSALGLKVFITSRPDLPIQLGFLPYKGGYEGVILHQLPEAIIKHDISTFLEQQLTKIRNDYNNSTHHDRKLSSDWPGTLSIQNLVEMSIPLFIFAATVCRFMGDRRLGSPEKQLKDVLEFREKRRVSQLDATYLPVLNRLIAGLPDKEQYQVLARNQRILGSIVTLASPLPTSVLSILLNLPKTDIEDHLDHLHSVLSVPLSATAPVKLLHLSFRDFLVDPDKRGNNPFWVDEKRTHSQLAEDCIRILSGRLKKNICDIESPGTSRTAVSSSDIDRCIPSEVQYSCLYWIYHLQNSELVLDDHGFFYAFLNVHFLHWLEALSLIGRAWEILRMIGDLQALPKSGSSMRLQEFLQDAMRWVRTSLWLIDSAPLQIYSSALIFAPKQSVVRNLFQHEMPHWLSLTVPNVEENWDQELQILETNGTLSKGRDSSLVFSHDSALVALGTKNGVWIWQANTGKLLHVLNTGDNAFWATSWVTFSPNSMFISAVQGKAKATKIFVWATDTGECLWELKGHDGPMAFSQDSKLLAFHARRPDNKYHAAGSPTWKTGTDFGGVVKVSRVDTGECIQEFRGISEVVKPLAFSSDSACVVSAMWRPPRDHCWDGECTVRIWRIDTGQCDFEWKLPVEGVFDRWDDEDYVGSAAALSRDANVLAFWDGDEIKVWDIKKKQCLRSSSLPRYHTHTTLTFSPDLTLAFCWSWQQNSLQVLSLDTGLCVENYAINSIKFQSRLVQAMAISPNSALIAVAMSDGTVRILSKCLDAPDNKPTGPIDSPELSQDPSQKSISKLVFSPDSTLIASISADGSMRVWRTNTGECLTINSDDNRVPWFESDRLIFSPDSSLLSRSIRESAPVDARFKSSIIRIWRTDTCAQVQEFRGGTVMAFSHDSALVALYEAGFVVRIYSVDSGECLQGLGRHRSKVSAAAFSHDSTWLASFSEPELRINVVETGECLRVLNIVFNAFGAHAPINLAFTHDSSLLLLLRGHKLNVWNTRTGQHLRQLDCDSAVLSINLHDTRIVTHRQMFNFTYDAAMTSGEALEITDVSHKYGLGYSNDGWITWNWHNVLWVPNNYRKRLVISGTTAALISPSSKLFMISFML